MAKRAYLEVDVFGRQAYLGNPLAVVAEGAGLDDARMQAFAHWTNLSETTFLLSPTDPAADYRVRIFTPARELPFAGHPTLGSCHAWLAQGGAPRRPDEIVQQCGIGLVRVRRRGAELAFCAPPLKRADVDDATLSRILLALRLPRSDVRAAQWLDNGPRWLGLLLDSAAAVLAIDPSHAALKTLAPVGVIGPHAPPGPGSSDSADFEVRAFAASDGINEDPVTGSLNAGLAQWLVAEGLAPAAYVVSQGARVRRDGRVRIEAVGGEVWVGGHCHTCVAGSASL